MGGTTINTKPTSPYYRPQYCRQDNTYHSANHRRPTLRQQKPVTRYTSSTNGRATKAVKIAEKEWDPYKHYETRGENRGPDIVRYRYGVDDSSQWCTSFFNYCFNPDHKSRQNVFGLSDKDVRSTRKIMEAAKKQGYFSTVSDIKRGKERVHVGDGIIWRSSDGKDGHIGIVVEVRSDGSFVTIQGNNNDHVQKIEYKSIEDAMTRTSSDGVKETLQGFAHTAAYYDDKGIRAEFTPEDRDPDAMSFEIMA